MQWERDEAIALECADGVVVALQPGQQSEWVARCLAHPNLERILVEKPLATSPDAARTLLDDLAQSGKGKVIRIGYTFRYTEWGRRLRGVLKQSGQGKRLLIEWRFLAHHFRHELSNWKRFTGSGGGAIRFYGIQLIALLAELGYRSVMRSESFGSSADVIEKWTASFSGPGLPECEVTVDTRSAVETFRAELLVGSATERAVVFANLSDPFDSRGTAEPSEGLDRRVPALTALCRSLWEPSLNEELWYKATIELWRSIEEATSFEISGRERLT
jgi:predicted dehydrogenase